MSTVSPVVTYPIGKKEIYVYFVIWIAHCLSSIWISSKSSRSLDPWLQGNIKQGYLSNLHYDNSDLEWSLHKSVILKIIGTLVLHSVIFRISHKFFHFYPIYTRFGCILFWSALTIYLTSFQCFSMIIMHAFITIIITAHFRKQWLAWATCLSFVIYANKYAYFSPPPEVYYIEYSFYLYTAIQILNVCIFLTRNPQQSLNFDLFLQFFEYFLYPPYSMTLIVLFEDFQSQISSMRHRSIFNNIWGTQINLINLSFKAFRLIFWYFFIEAFLHFIHANAVVNAPFTLVGGLANYEVASIAYMSGQFFYLKYVIIFGMPSFFALVDGMTPPGPPICISRVSKYSQMWRYFDRGLYEFLKNQVYIPLMGTTKGIEAILRRLFGMIAVFGFVLTWHGTKSNYLMWVLLSAFELVMERIGKSISGTQTWNDITMKIGSANILRITAIAMDLTIIPGLLGAFFFLSQVGTGDEIMRKLVIEGFGEIFEGNLSWSEPGGVMLHMLILGYFYNHCCLYLEHVMHPRLSKSKIE